jgi:hypothetical protein
LAPSYATSTTGSGGPLTPSGPCLSRLWRVRPGLGLSPSMRIAAPVEGSKLRIPALAHAEDELAFCNSAAKLRGSAIPYTSRVPRTTARWCGKTCSSSGNNGRDTIAPVSGCSYHRAAGSCRSTRHVKPIRPAARGFEKDQDDRHPVHHKLTPHRFHHLGCRAAACEPTPMDLPRHVAKPGNRACPREGPE